MNKPCRTHSARVPHSPADACWCQPFEDGQAHPNCPMHGEAAAKSPVLLVVSDAYTIHELAEEHLDTWWASLDPNTKAEIYEAALDAEPEAIIPAAADTAQFEVAMREAEQRMAEIVARPLTRPEVHLA